MVYYSCKQFVVIHYVTVFKASKTFADGSVLLTKLVSVLLTIAAFYPKLKKTALFTMLGTVIVLVVIIYVGGLDLWRLLELMWTTTVVMGGRYLIAHRVGQIN